MDKIAQAITRLFDKHRIVFWYDEKKELRQEYESFWLTGVEKIELNNNEYHVKYLILREKPSQKFLLYREGPQPDELNNWLLDVQLAQGLFSADQVSLWVNELELSPSLWNLVQDHIEFFKDERCRIALKTRLVKDDGHNAIRIKMLAVCVNADIENRIESILEVLLADLAESQREKFGLIQVCNLDAFLWEKLATHFGYKSQSPSIRDFAITLFKSCYAQALDEESVLTQDALVFLKRWRDSIHYRESFENLSEEFAGILGVEQDLQNRDVLPLIDVDFFRLIDQRILSGLAQQIHERTLSAGDYANIIWRRRTTHWYKEFSDMYEALYYGSQFIHELGNADLHMDTLADGVRKYQNTWYKLDQHYRKFIMHVRAVQQKDLLVKLIELVENLYSNNYLLQVSDNWQKQVDSAPLWDAAPIPRQSEFFSRYISEYLANKNKVAVIISDALRYEIGQELAEIIEKEEGYSVEIDSMLSELPSYTQLGMAALLPNSELKILPDGNVLVDGKPSAGLENRSKILSNTVDKGSIALRSEELLSMNRDKYREVTKGAQVVYVYHDQIDHVGDDRTSEGQVFDVVEKASSEILTLMKKLYDSYFSNILITADHGFIYQNQPLDESEFAFQEAEGQKITFRNRRFVIGTGLKPNKSMKVFSLRELKLHGEVQVMIPKSIKRLRIQGSGSRYVHGGVALQEVVIPVIRVNKKRGTDTKLVEVEVIAQSTNITSGQLTVAFYQTEPVSGKVLERYIRAGIYSMDGTPLSDVHNLNFNLTSENPREREVKKQFVLSRKADEVNNQTVYLKLEEPVPDSTYFKEYKTLSYQLRRSFTTDFDL